MLGAAADLVTQAAHQVQAERVVVVTAPPLAMQLMVKLILEVAAADLSVQVI
jgi:hypothetical protein